MSSDNNDHKQDSAAPAPTSGTATRSSARAPSAWGPIRHAIASLHNLGALLKSTSVKYKVILDLLPELSATVGVLREAFDRARTAPDPALVEVGHYGLRGVQALADLLDATALANEERDDLSIQARVLADDLEATSDLLALLDRAAEPVPTSVGVQLLVRETGRLWGGGRGRELVVHFDESPAGLSIDCDPYVVGPLLSLLLALVRSAVAGDVLVRATSAGEEVTIVVDEVGPGDADLQTIRVRALPPVPPTECAARRVAEQAGASLELAGTRAVLRVRQAVG